LCFDEVSNCLVYCIDAAVRARVYSSSDEAFMKPALLCFLPLVYCILLYCISCVMVKYIQSVHSVAKFVWKSIRSKITIPYPLIVSVRHLQVHLRCRDHLCRDPLDSRTSPKTERKKSCG